MLRALLHSAAGAWKGRAMRGCQRVWFHGGLPTMVSALTMNASEAVICAAAGHAFEPLYPKAGFCRGQRGALMQGQKRVEDANVLRLGCPSRQT